MEITEEQLQLIKEIFDNKLDNTGNNYLFDDLIDTTGVFGCMELCSKIKYDREKELIKKALETSFKSWLTQPQPKIDYVFGCRDPKTDPQTWNGAFVIVKTVGDSDITTALFQNGMDYIGHTRYYDKVMTCYNWHIKDGWLPMSKDDLEKTAGIIIDNNTRIGPIKQINPRKWTLIGIGSALVALIICKYK